MTSEVAICKLALSYVGDEAIITSISPPDGTSQADLCATFYPVARDTLLEMHPWPFATKRTAVAAVTNDLANDWQYAYTLPADCLRPLDALYPGVPAKVLGIDSDAESWPYVVEARADGSPVLYTNVQTASLRYIAAITDTTRFTPLFTLALARLLASHLAGPIIKGEVGMKVAQAQFTAFEKVDFPTAAAKASNVGKRDFTMRQPSFVAARSGIFRFPPTR